MIRHPPGFYGKFSGLLNTLLIDKEFSQATVEHKVVMPANIAFKKQVLFFPQFLNLEKSQYIREFFIAYRGKFSYMALKYFRHGSSNIVSLQIPAPHQSQQKHLGSPCRSCWEKRLRQKLSGYR